MIHCGHQKQQHLEQGGATRHLRPFHRPFVSHNWIRSRMGAVGWLPSSASHFLDRTQGNG